MEQRRKYFDWFKFAKPARAKRLTRTARLTTSGPTKRKPAERIRRNVLQWFKDVGREYGDGASFPKFLINIRKDAIATLTERSERTDLGR